MSTGKTWAVYVLIRLAFFGVPFALFAWLGTVIWFPLWLAALFAAIIGLALSLLVLNPQRDTASSSIYEWRQRKRTADEVAEDEAIEASAPATDEPR